MGVAPLNSDFETVAPRLFEEPANPGYKGAYESDCEELSGDMVDTEDREELVLGAKMLKTPFLISDWRETFTNGGCLSFAFLLPCDCHKDYKLSVTNNGNNFQVQIT